MIYTLTKRGDYMDKSFIGNRITELRLEKNISERELSQSLAKADNYINGITSGKILPSMESFLDICDYFEITPYEFFYSSMKNPVMTKKIYEEILRLTQDNPKILLTILESLTRENYDEIVSYFRRFKWNYEHSGNL